MSGFVQVCQGARLDDVMPKKPLGGYSVRVWVTLSDLEKYKRLAASTGLQQSEIMSRVLAAGLAALPQDQLVLPLEFEIVNELKRGKSAIVVNDESPSTTPAPSSRVRHSKG